MRSVFVRLQCPAPLAGGSAGTPTTGSAAPASRTEIHPALAEMGAKLMEMPAFVCVFVRGMGIFALKCGQKLEKNGGFVTEIWGEGGDAKRQSRHHIFDFGTLFVGASVYVYKWTNRHCNGLRVSGLQQVGGGTPGRFWLKADGFPRKIFYFFRIFPNSALFSCKYLIINNKYLSLKLRFSFRN